jgi:hypothetical protein
VDIEKRLGELRQQLATLRTRQQEAHKVVQDSLTSIQQHLGAIAILEEQLTEEANGKSGKKEDKA